MASSFQFITVGSGTTILPYDRIINWFAGLAVPYYCCFPLIGNANTQYLPHGDISLGNCFGKRAILRAPDLFGVVLHPSGFWENLPEFLLCHTDNVAMMIEDHTAATLS